MTLFKNKLTQLKNTLIHLNNDEPISKFTMVVIIALDIFILTTIFSGLEDHTRQLTSVNQFLPYQCEQTFIKKPILKLKTLDKLTYLVTDYYDTQNSYNQYSHYYNVFLNDNINKAHPICQSFFHSIKAIAEDKTLKSSLEKRLTITKKITELHKAFNQQKNTYDTGLLEKIANKTKTVITSKAKFYKEQLSFQEAKVTKIDNELNTYPLIKDFVTLVIKKHKKVLSVDLQQFEFWYELKKWLWQLLFLLPIFGLLYFWHSKTIQRKNTVQTLISSHLLVVTSLPIIIKTFTLVFDLIPHFLLKHIFKILESLYLVGIWHYFVMIFVTIVSIFIIYFVHKKLFNAQKIYQQRLKKGHCYCCNKKLPNNATHCIFCSKKQTIPCNACHSETYINGQYCQNCGQTKS